MNTTIYNRIALKLAAMNLRYEKFGDTIIVRNTTYDQQEELTKFLSKYKDKGVAFRVQAFEIFIIVP